MSYRDGTPSGGRPKGRLSDKTIAVQRFCREVCEDEEYRTAILHRARTNTLGSMEAVVWAYAYGKPKETVDMRLGRIGGEEDLSHLSLKELLQRADELRKTIAEAAELEHVLALRPQPVGLLEPLSQEED